MEHPLHAFITSKEFIDHYNSISTGKDFSSFQRSVDILCPGGKGLGYFFKMLAPHINLGGYAPQIKIGGPDPLSSDPLLHLDYNLQAFRYRYEVLDPAQTLSEGLKLGCTVGKLIGALEAMNTDAKLMTPIPPPTRLFDLILAGAAANPNQTGLMLVDLVAIEQLALLGYIDLFPLIKAEVLSQMKQARADYAQFKAFYEQAGDLNPLTVSNTPPPAEAATEPLDLSQVNITDLIAELEKGFNAPPM